MKDTIQRVHHSPRKPKTREEIMQNGEIPKRPPHSHRKVKVAEIEPLPPRKASLPDAAKHASRSPRSAPYGSKKKNMDHLQRKANQMSGAIAIAEARADGNPSARDAVKLSTMYSQALKTKIELLDAAS